MSGFSFAGIQISCPLCGRDEHTAVSDADRHGDPLRTVLCSDCGHVFTNPQPTAQEIKNFYEKRYRAAYKGVVTPKLKHVYRAGSRALERFSQLEPHCEKGMQILDIGSGGGEFVYLMHSLGFTVNGIEPNQGYAAFSQQEYGTDIKMGGVEDLDRTGRSYDVITMHHVLEHLADPIAALKSLRETLNETGLLIVEVPNAEARYHGPRRQYHLAHLHTFSQEGLISSGRCAGLETVETRLQPHTRHISVAFKKTENSSEMRADKNVAQRVEANLRGYTPIGDRFSVRPYRKLWANVKRPIKERLAIAKLGNPNNAKEILDRLYAPTVEAFSASRDRGRS